MRKFNITVNGKAYEVEVEEIGGRGSCNACASGSTERQHQKQHRLPAPAAAAPAAAPAAAAPAAAPVAGGSTVSAPMPGTVLDIKVAVGDTVKVNDVLMILEAMKMENEIMAPVAGKVAQISVSKGASVNSGDVMIVIA